MGEERIVKVFIVCLAFNQYNSVAKGLVVLALAGLIIYRPKIARMETGVQGKEDGRFIMSAKVPEHILKATTKCPHSFSCLETGTCGKTCEVDDDACKNFLYLKNTKHTDCPYRVPFAHKQCCTCPTRYALYRNSSNPYSRPL